MSNKSNNPHIINVLVDFLFKSIERSQYTLNESYNAIHSKRKLFAIYLLDKENVTPGAVLNSINKPDTIVEIINNMKKSLTENENKFPNIVTHDMIERVTKKLNILLETATTLKSQLQ